MPQHDDDYAAARPVIEMAQRLHASLHAKLMEKGVLPIDVAIAATWAAHNAAARVMGALAAANC